MAPHMGSGSEPARPCGMVGLQAFLYLRLQCEPSLILTAGLGKGRTGEGGRHSRISLLPHHRSRGWRGHCDTSKLILLGKVLVDGGQTHQLQN